MDAAHATGRDDVAGGTALGTGRAAGASAPGADADADADADAAGVNADRRTLQRRPMTALVRDLRLAVRVLLGTKTWTLVVLLSLALGIGANTALFTAVNGLLLQTVSVREPERLVRFNHAGPNDMVRNSNDYGYSGDVRHAERPVHVLLPDDRAAACRQHDADRPGRGRADGEPERPRGRRRPAGHRLSGHRQLLHRDRRAGRPGPRVRRGR